MTVVFPFSPLRTDGLTGGLGFKSEIVGGGTERNQVARRDAERIGATRDAAHCLLRSWPPAAVAARKGERATRRRSKSERKIASVSYPTLFFPSFLLSSLTLTSCNNGATMSE